jgi:hypothetical protein
MKRTGSIRCVSVALLLSLGACSAEFDETSDEQLVEGEQSGAEHASIDTPLGKRFSLAGKANLAATNALLADSGQAFVAGQASDFPDPYWGLNSQSEAYVILDVMSYDDSTWTLDDLEVTGPFTIFALTVYGFRTDADGEPVDLNDDGIIDSLDWHALEERTRLSGSDPTHSDELTEIYSQVFGASVVASSSAIEDVDAEGYPNGARLGSNELILSIGEDNANRCTPDMVEYERCWFWEEFVGEAPTSYPAPASLLRTWAFNHVGNNWIRYDDAADTFEVADSSLADLLDEIEFSPLFWVRASDSSFDIDVDL